MTTDVVEPTTRVVEDDTAVPDRDLVGTYLHEISRTAVLNACRSVHRRRVIAGRFRGSAEARWWAEPVPSPEVAVLLAEDRRNVYRALLALPRRQREALVLRYYQRLSEPEIAETMGISRGTVKSTLSRGLAALGRTLSKEDGS